MNISDYFIVFYADNKPIADFDFYRFSHPEYYIVSCLKNAKYCYFTVYTHDDCIYKIDIPKHDYYIYWPFSLLRLYNRLAFNHNLKSPLLSPFRTYNKHHFSSYKFRNRFKAINVMK